jgi:hypothetical protein
VALKKAALQSAQINLGYTQVRAPISGRIGKSTVTAGALVTANQDTALATIRALDPMYVDLTQSSAQLLQLRRLLGTEGMQSGSRNVRLKTCCTTGTGDHPLSPLRLRKGRKNELTLAGVLERVERDRVRGQLLQQWHHASEFSIHMNRRIEARGRGDCHRRGAAIEHKDRVQYNGARAAREHEFATCDSGHFHFLYLEVDGSFVPGITAARQVRMLSRGI